MPVDTPLSPDGESLNSHGKPVSGCSKSPLITAWVCRHLIAVVVVAGAVAVRLTVAGILRQLHALLTRLAGYVEARHCAGVTSRGTRVEAAPSVMTEVTTGVTVVPVTVTGVGKPRYDTQYGVASVGVARRQRRRLSWLH